jgi:uncharacterized protein (DUF2062 family)
LAQFLNLLSLADTSWSVAPPVFDASITQPAVAAAEVTRDGRLVVSGRAFTPSSRAFAYALVAEPVVVPCGAGPQCMCVAGKCMTQEDFVAPNANSSAEVLQLLVVNGNVTVNGNLIVGNTGRLVVTPGAVITVSGTTFGGGTVVVQAQVSSAFPVIVAEGGVVGSFVGAELDPATLPPCQIGTAQLTRTEMTLGVVVSLQRTPDFCLTPGELAGLIVGVTCGGILIAVAIILITKYASASYTSRRNAELREEGLSEIKGAPNPAFGQTTSVEL